MMQAYFGVFKIRMLHSLQYRAAAIAGIATQFFWGAIMLMVYLAFYGDLDSVNGFTKEQLMTYIWLQQAFLIFIALWLRDNTLFEAIRTGNIAYELCRPLNVYYFWYAKLTATRLSGAALRSLPILLVAYLLPAAYRMHPPESLGHFFLFVIALFLGVFINIAISMFIYISVFVTLSPVGSILIIGVIGEFFSGLVLPIPLMPDGLRQIVMILPFRYTGDLAFRIYSGNLSVHEGLKGIGIQIIWLVALTALGNLLMQKALKHLVIQGG